MRNIVNNADLDSITGLGIYKIQGIESNGPESAYGFGMLLVFRISNDNENRIVQIYVSHSEEFPDLYIRVCNRNKWSGWSAFARDNS